MQRADKRTKGAYPGLIAPMASWDRETQRTRDAQRLRDNAHGTSLTKQMAILIEDSDHTAGVLALLRASGAAESRRELGQQAGIRGDSEQEVGRTKWQATQETRQGYLRRQEQRGSCLRRSN